MRYASLNNGSIAYKIKVNGDTLLVVNNHLESNKLTEKDKEVYREMMKDPDKQKVSQGSRLLIRKLAEASAIRAVQADSIARLVAGYKGGGIIVCGDFNDSPISYTHRVVGEGLNDALWSRETALAYLIIKIILFQNRQYFIEQEFKILPLYGG